eukprot:COSAG05_NODE_22721_length_263_cov_0.512195_2_plen_80_part_01
MGYAHHQPIIRARLLLSLTLRALSLSAAPAAVRRRPRRRLLFIMQQTANEIHWRDWSADVSLSDQAWASWRPSCKPWSRR